MNDLYKTKRLRGNAQTAFYVFPVYPPGKQDYYIIILP